MSERSNELFPELLVKINQGKIGIFNIRYSGFLILKPRSFIQGLKVLPRKIISKKIKIFF